MEFYELKHWSQVLNFFGDFREILFHLKIEPSNARLVNYLIF